MNLNHPTQHSSNSNPSAVALRAATLSYDKSVTTITSPTEHSSNRSATKKGCVINKISTASSPIGKVGTGDKGHLPAIQQRKLKDKMQEHQYGPSVSKTPLLQKSSSMVVGDAAAAEFRTRIAKGGTKVGKGDDKPATGTVDTCSRLLRDGVALEEYSPTLSEDVSPKHSRLPDLSVDSTSLEDISSLKNLFEKGATICAPKHIRPVSENPSLTAAIIATQVSSSNPTHSSSRGSPILKQSSKPAQGISTPLNFDNRSSSHITAHEPSPVLLDSKQSEIYETSGLSDHKNALLAATLSVKPKIPRTPLKKTQPPRPPPPRRAHDGLKVPNGKILGVEDNSDALSIHSARTGFSKYDTARSSVSLQPSLSHSIISPIPKRRLSLGNIPHQMAGGKSLVVSGATLSTASPHIDPVHGSCRQPLPVSQHLTGDAVIAASLAPSHVNSPAPRKRPAPPAPRRSRRKSLPSPPKKGFRETMGKPRYSPAEASPQRKMPNLVKHHPHKHSERERRRWRPFITDVERRRYEGLWAANKGLLLATCDSKSEGPSPYSPSLQQRKSHEPDSSQSQHMWSSTPGYTEDLSDYVHSLVARDIWTRSRLPLNHLADIWDLVDRSMKGRLSRDEFVVGTWLIDQSLKGRKLPLSIQDEVWQSVRRLGVKIPSPGCKSTTYSKGH